MIALRQFLRRHHRIGIDTSIFIYELEANDRYASQADAVFRWLERPGHSGVTSTITMTELLVQPFRQQDEDRVNLFYGLLTTYPNLEWAPTTLAIASMAASLRAEHRLKTPDALHAATAVFSGATGFVTNDSVFKRIEAFETLVIDEI